MAVSKVMESDPTSSISGFARPATGSSQVQAAAVCGARSSHFWDQWRGTDLAVAQGGFVAETFRILYFIVLLRMVDVEYY